MLVYCCLKWIYRHGGARAQRRCKSLPRGWHERGGGLPPGQGVPASPGGCGAGFPVGPYGAHPGTAVPSPSHSPARRNENKMVIMLQSSSGKGSEADEKPYLRVRPLLLITRSEAVNSADTAITGNEPGPVLGPRLPGCGMGTGERGWAAAGWVVSAAFGAAWPVGAKPLGRHQLHLGLAGRFLGFSGKVGVAQEGIWSTGLPPAGQEVAEVCSKAEAWLKLRTGVTPAARSMAGTGTRAGCGDRGHGAVAGTGLGWAGPTVTVLAQAGCARPGSICGNITPRQRLQ